MMYFYIYHLSTVILLTLNVYSFIMPLVTWSGEHYHEWCHLSCLGLEWVSHQHKEDFAQLCCPLSSCRPSPTVTVIDLTYHKLSLSLFRFSFVWSQWYTDASLYCLASADRVYISSSLLQWFLESGHSRSIFTMEAGKCYSLDLFLFCFLRGMSLTSTSPPLL